MKATDIIADRLYSVKIKSKTYPLRVDKISSVDEETEEGKVARTIYTFECTDEKTGRKYTVRNPGHFVEEIVQRPVVDDLVKIVKGTGKGSLSADMIYRVKSVAQKTAVIVAGKKEHRVAISDLRVTTDIKKEEASTFEKNFPTLAAKAKEEATKTEGEEGSDPHRNGTARSPVATAAEKLVAPQTSVPSTAPVSGSLSDLDRLVADAESESETSGESQERLFGRAVRSGCDPRQVEGAKSWEEVGDMIREKTRPVVQSVPVRNGTSKGPSKLVTALSQPKAKHIDDSPHLIVEARAGTGKTTTLIEGLRIVLGQESKLVPSPQQKAVWDAMALSRGKVGTIAMVAFNKSIATELQTRVPAGVAAMTMHSMGFKAVMSSIGKVKVESYRVMNILSELMEMDVRDMRKDDETFALSIMVEKLVGLCKMNLVIDPDEEALDTLAAHYDIEVNGNREKVYQMVPLVLKRCRDVKADMEIDFNDMIWLPVVLDLPVTKYDLLLVDEAQDLNRCQQALAKKAGHRLILCGDKAQAIYGFAGADAESMDRMFGELNASARFEMKCPDCVGGVVGGADLAPHNRCPTCRGKQLLPMGGCMRLPLTVTRRCGAAIVEEAKKIVPDFDGFEGNGPGKIGRARYPDPKAKSGPTASDYSSQVLDGDMILCRVNAPLVSQCFRFLKAGRRATIQGRDIGQGLIKLVQKFKVGSVVDLVKCLSDWYFGETRKENAKRNPSDARLIALEDKYECLLAFTDGLNTADEVVRKIEAVFVDDQNVRGIKFSSIHRAKGLESKRVFFLMPKGGECPHPMAKSPWQVEQEMNLKYVAITRAIEELIFVTPETTTEPK